MKNNKKMRQARKQIQIAVIQLLQTKTINQLKVTQICRLAHINRSTFYANYEDVYDMVDHLRNYVSQQYQSYLKIDRKSSLLSLLKEIQNHQDIYQLFFRLYLDKNLIHKVNFSQWVSYPRDSTVYDIVFVQSAIREVIMTWLNNQCDVSPEQINQLIVRKLKQLGIKLNE